MNTNPYVFLFISELFALIIAISVTLVVVILIIVPIVKYR